MSGILRTRLEAMQDGMRHAAKGYRNLVDLRILPSAHFAEALLEAEHLEYTTAFDIDELVADLREHLGDEIEAEFESNYEGEDVREAAAARKGVAR